MIFSRYGCEGAYAEKFKRIHFSKVIENSKNENQYNLTLHRTLFQYLIYINQWNNLCV